MTFASKQIIKFESYEIDVRRGELRNADQLVPVEPQVFDLIAFLASEPGRVFSRDEIIDAVWHGRIVSDSAISTRINAARQAVGDDGKSQRIIRTVPRRGFLFVPETDVVEAATSEERNTVLSTQSALPLPNKPSVAVLPFDNMSGDPEQSYFSDGITDDIITELSRYDELFVISRQSSFAYRDEPLDAGDIAQELGVQYVLKGSVRRVGKRIRITVQLIDAIARNNIWADRYDRDLEDVFAIQDEITGVVVNTLVGELTRRHYKHALQKPPTEMDAYDHALRAAILFHRFNPTDNRKARVEAEAALAIDGSVRANRLEAGERVS
jgi:TolB-like protein